MKSVVCFAALLLTAGLRAQDLEPRAYSVSPVGVNVVVVAYGFLKGDVVFDPTIPIEDVSARIHGVSLGYFRSLNVFGRSGNFSIGMPYTAGDITGKVGGDAGSITRSGLGDGRFRFAVNLKGAPAMSLEDFAGYRQRTNIGASVTVVGPTGQYDPARLISIGKDRLAIKPELGLSRTLGRRWILDLYGGVWFFTKDSRYLGAGREQDPIGAVQTHLSYSIKPRLWAAFDATFFAGGKQRIGGGEPSGLMRNTRYGGTLSIPLRRRQSLKFAISTGAFTSTGADFDAVAVAYQYLWGGGL